MGVRSIIQRGITMAMTPGLGTHTIGSTMIGESILPVMHIIAIEVIIHHQVTILITITTVTTDQITVVTGVLTMDSTVTATMAATVPIVVVTSLIQTGSVKGTQSRTGDLRKTLDSMRTPAGSNSCWVPPPSSVTPQHYRAGSPVHLPGSVCRHPPHHSQSGLCEHPNLD